MFSKFFKKSGKYKSNGLNSQNTRKTDARDYDVVIHIGTPKTGTSAIQNFLHTNRILLEKKGFYYPPHSLDKNGISGGHSVWAIALMEKRVQDAEKLLVDWETHAKNIHKTLLLSSESFFSIPNLFKPFIENKKVLIIAYQRDLVSYLVSVHNQLIKRHFATQPFNAYVQTMMDNPKGTPNLVSQSFAKIYQQWEELVGTENLIVRSYQSDCFADGRIEIDFLTRLNIDPDTFILAAKKINISYQPEALEVKRVINHVLERKDTKIAHQIDLILQEYSERSGIEKNEIDIDPEIFKELKDFLQDEEKTIQENYIENYMESDIPSYTVVEKKKNYLRNKESLKEPLKMLFHNSEVKKYLYEQTLNKLTQGSLSYPVFKLAELLEIDDLESYRPGEGTWFTKQQLKKMANGKYQNADFLRDIAELLLSKGDLDHASLLVEKALEERPNGPILMQLKEKIKAKRK